jgi:hypothetical protein
MFNFHTTRFVFFGIIVTSSIVLLSVYARNTSMATPIESQAPAVTPAPENPYNPAQYGVPDILGGYKVLAILTLRDVACMPPQVKRVLLQAHQRTVHEYLQQPQPLAEVLTYLHQLPGEANTKWQLSMVGPGVTIEKVEANNKSWNAEFVNRPCLRLGPVDISEFTVVPRK